MQRVASFMTVLGLLLAGCGEQGSGDAGGESPKGSADVRLGDAELQGRWWSWALEGHGAALEDTTGENCAIGQPDDVWFLAGTFGGRATRTCRVAEGRPLAFPVVTITSSVESDCEAFLESASGSADLDGKPLEVEPIAATRVTIESDHGPGEYFACGLWTQTAGLDAGRHTVTFGGRSGSFRTRVDYTLIVR